MCIPQEKETIQIESIPFKPTPYKTFEWIQIFQTWFIFGQWTSVKVKVGE